MSIPRPMVPLPAADLHQRAGDLDRSAVCDQLSTHFAAGRLRADELDARLTAAVNAETLLDLRRLVGDLPLAPAPLQPPPPPLRSPSWPTLDVLALLALIGCLCFAGLMVLSLGLGVGHDAGILAACLFGGTIAATGGAALTHLLHRRWPQSSRDRSNSDSGQRPRIA